METKHTIKISSSSSSSRSPTRPVQQQWWSWWSSSGPPSPHIISGEAELLRALLLGVWGICYLSCRSIFLSLFLQLTYTCTKEWGIWHFHVQCVHWYPVWNFSKYYNGIKRLTQTLWHEMTWPWPEIEILTSEMDFAYLKTHKKTFYTSILGNWLESSFSRWVNSCGHLGFMQITRVVQSSHLGNKAEFVLGPIRLRITKKIT